MSFTLLGILNSQAAGAGGAGAYDLLETTVLTSSASSVSFTGLDSYTDYKHLQMRMVLRDTRTAFSLNSVNVRVNSDSGLNYAQHYLQGNGSSVASGGATSGQGIRSMNLATISTDLAPSGAFGASVIDILDFSNTSKYSTFRSLDGFYSDGTRHNINLRSGLWLNTATITTLEILSNSEQFVAGSRLSLYGIK